MASEVQICNRALQKLGSEPITSLADDTKAARECSRAYADTRDAELRDHNWNFAITRAQLPALSADPLWGFGKQFQLPADCLRVIELNALNDPDDWTVEGRQLLANAAAPLDVRYVKRETDTGVFDPLFVEVLAARLAFELAEALTQSNTKKAQAFDVYREALRKARRADAVEGTPDALEESTWLEARR